MLYTGVGKQWPVGKMRPSSKKKGLMMKAEDLTLIVCIKSVDKNINNKKK